MPTFHALGGKTVRNPSGSREQPGCKLKSAVKKRIREFEPTISGPGRERICSVSVAGFRPANQRAPEGGGQIAVRLYWQRVTETPGHCYDRALALTGTGVLFRQIDFGSPNATVLVNTLFLADFGSAYVRRTCRVRDVFGRGPIVPDGLELWAAVFATDEGAELTRERTFRIGEKLLGRFSTRDRHSHVFDIDFATAKQVDIQGQRR